MDKKQTGFTLIEVLLYLGIFIIIGGLFFGVLTQIIRISSHETSGNEVTNQLNFVTQTVNRLVKASSNIETAAGLSTTTLKLRMKDPALDPTCIYLSNNSVLLAEGPDALNPQNCTTNSSKIMPITTSKVIVNSLNFKKLTFYPGHDQVLVDVQISSADTNPAAQVARTLHSAISRVSAATFDSNLVPGATNAFTIGVSGSAWRSINDLIYFSSNNVGVGVQNPTAKLQVGSGNIYVDTTGNSLIFKDSSGVCHKLTVSTGSVLSAPIIACP